MRETGVLDLTSRGNLLAALADLVTVSKGEIFDISMHLGANYFEFGPHNPNFRLENVQVRMIPNEKYVVATNEQALTQNIGSFNKNAKSMSFGARLKCIETKEDEVADGFSSGGLDGDSVVKMLKQFGVAFRERILDVEVVADWRYLYPNAQPLESDVTGSIALHTLPAVANLFGPT